MMIALYLFVGIGAAIAILSQVVVWTVIVAVLGVPRNARRKLGHRGLLRAANDGNDLDPLARAAATLYARRMRRVNAMLLACGALAIGALVTALIGLGTFDERDACLDRGGAWDFKNDRCAR